MKMQEAFDRMVRGLAGQGWEQSLHSRWKATDGTPMCAYRSPNGHRCAVGHLLTDEEAAYADRDGIGCAPLGVAGFSYRDAAPAWLRDPAMLNMLAVAQNCHDGARIPHRMRAGFVALAERFDLVWPEDVPR